LRLRKDAGAAQGWTLDAAMREHLAGRYLLPEPRMQLADALRAHASAAMDVSDGLAGDLTKLCGVSGVSAKVDVASVPLSTAAQRALAVDRTLIEPILSGGDDYEIVCTMRSDNVPAFRAQAAKAQVAVAEIGLVIDGTDEPRFIDANGAALALSRKSFSHF
jgi:thiamine-monophosphate kinase